MRLIDADDFKKFIQALCKAGSTYESFIELLDKQTTAYDIDKVVKKLEQKKEEVQRMRNTCVALSDLEVCDIENVTYERAIEIVKQGGVSETEQKLKEMESESE